ncbi:MAG: glycine cleavage T C-terminal barrel domain-containing protein, partial [Candidatus Neomarinimicrobiota bacterium]|nr:glycine cleavage T C-terminal barrel domain-containing protein [Candidatus Neomarinimicrobiota bacterium]
IPRAGCEIFYNKTPVGKVTSGTMSPSLKKGIGIGYIGKSYYRIGSKIMIDLRGKLKEAQIIKPPFYKSGSLRN